MSFDFLSFTIMLDTIASSHRLQSQEFEFMSILPCTRILPGKWWNRLRPRSITFDPSKTSISLQNIYITRNHVQSLFSFSSRHKIISTVAWCLHGDGFWMNWDTMSIPEWEPSPHVEQTNLHQNESQSHLLFSARLYQSSTSFHTLDHAPVWSISTTDQSIYNRRSVSRGQFSLQFIGFPTLYDMPTSLVCAAKRQHTNKPSLPSVRHARCLATTTNHCWCLGNHETCQW